MKMKIETFTSDKLVDLGNFNFLINFNKTGKIKYVKLNNIFDLEYTTEKDNQIKIKIKDELRKILNNFWMVTVFYHV